MVCGCRRSARRGEETIVRSVRGKEEWAVGFWHRGKIMLPVGFWGVKGIEERT